MNNDFPLPRLQILCKQFVKEKMENLERTTSWSPEHDRYCFARTLELAEGQASGARLIGCLENVKDYTYALDEYQVGEEMVDWHIFSIPDVLQSKKCSASTNLKQDEIMITTYSLGTEIHISMVLSDNRESSIETVKNFLAAFSRPATLH